MAKFSQTFLQGLLNPSYQQGLFEAARGVGQAPGIMRMERQRVDRQAEIKKLLQENMDNPAKLQQLAQQYLAQGQEDIAKAFTNAATQATARQEKRKEAATGRGEGELIALANDTKFDLNDQKMRSGFLGMADAFEVSRGRAMEIALEARENRKGADGDFRTTDQVTIRDEKGNEFIQYSIQNIKNPTDTPIIKTVPVGSAPNELSLIHI